MLPLPRIVKKWRAHQKERELLSFLKSVQTENVPHYRKNLFAHLTNTYATLKRWECEPDLCYAGLFHSIYGTQIFKRQTIPYAERERIRQLIGEHSERLSYLFSVCDRPAGLLAALETRRVRDTAANQDVGVTSLELTELLLIECANLQDQGGAESFCVQVLKNIDQFHFPTLPLYLEILRKVLGEARAH